MDETGLTASTRRFMERRDGSPHGSISRGNDFTEGMMEKMTGNFRELTSIRMNRDEFLRATNLPNGREEVESVVVRLDRCHIF